MSLFNFNFIIFSQFDLSYLGDGRFHLESIMIHNPEIPAFQYVDPCEVISKLILGL